MNLISACLHESIPVTYAIHIIKNIKCSLHQRIFVGQCLDNGSCFRDLLLATLDNHGDCLRNLVHIFGVHASAGNGRCA